MRMHLSLQRTTVGRMVTTVIVVVILVLPYLGYAQAVEESERITAVVWSPNGERVATSYRDGHIVITSLDERQTPLTLHADTSRILALAWSPDGRFLASGSISPDDTLRIWNTANAVEVFAVSDFGLDILSVAWSPDGRQVIAVTAEPFNTPENAISLDTTTWQISPFSTGADSDIAWSPDHTQIAFADIAYGVQVYDATTLQLLSIYPYDNDPSRPEFLPLLIRITWSPDGMYLAGGTGDGRVILWRVGTPEPRLVLEGNTYQGEDTALAWINHLRFDASGQYLTSVSGDGVIRTWSIADGSLLVERMTTPNYAAEFSPYGGRLAIGAASPIDVGSADRDTVQIIVPDPSPERLRSIAEMCGAPVTVDRQLDSAIAANDMLGFIAQVEALPEGTIPPACAADLLAVAEALQGE